MVATPSKWPGRYAPQSGPAVAPTRTRVSSPGGYIAAVSGALLLLFMYLAALPLQTNPVLDDHLTMALTIVALALLGAGDVLGLGKVWKKLPIVRGNRWLTVTISVKGKTDRELRDEAAVLARAGFELTAMG